MEIVAYNPHKSRYETIDAKFTADNTPWLSNCTGAGFEGDLLVR
jgi:hypothetical protein